MHNYGEELAYWYLRLNGFIPMADFVLHRRPDTYTSDCDLVAVRFPHVYEEVGGMAGDWDADLLRVLGVNETLPLVLFVQVKAGKYDLREIDAYFARHLRSLVQRVGLTPEGEVDDVVSRLSRDACSPEDTAVFSKMAILRPRGRELSGCPFISWDLDRCISFISERMRRIDQKYSDRMFFPSSIIQFLADQSRHG